MSVLHTIWRLLDPRQRRSLIGLQLLSIVMALTTVGGVAAVLPFFAALADPNSIKHYAIARAILRSVRLDDSSFVLVLGIGFGAAVLVANAVNLYGFLAISRFATRVGDALYVRLFDEYMHREYEFHARNSVSVLAGKVQESVRVTCVILQQALTLVTSLVTILFVTAAVVLVNPVVAVCATAGLGASYAAIYVTTRGRLSRNGQTESRHHAERTRTINEGFGAIKEVTLLQSHDFFVGRFAQQSRFISRAAGSTLAISQSPKYVLECLTVVCLIAVALYLHNGSPAAGPWVAQLSFVGFAAYRLLPALQQVFAAIVRIRADRAAFAAIETDVERAGPQWAISPTDVPAGAWHGRPHHDIRLRDVSFRYSHNQPDAVRNVSLTIPAGVIVGFVGANGSGKTTLLDLVSGLLAPQSGYIEVDGVRLERANLRAWQANIAYVPQQVFLLEATLAENIAFGVAPAQIDRERLEAAARSACLTECVASLPRGYEERLGASGRALSGGQRQRLAIARALYRDASLLILDEATSALDAASESELAETLQWLRSDRTVLVIAHRTGVLRHCDLVFELSGGSIVGSGKYGQLEPVKTRAVNAF
jgi:ABC-type bacteriocin/lantibiotic exporter with double-glycine peptidase domain